ncbi:MAG: WecB/TagA/CpsF family glycosyltransferase [Anaerolineae bacterium]|nr:WecB/TagA/CpsF family glycosyltransferase [Anaerolineae bacterium]
MKLDLFGVQTDAQPFAEAVDRLAEWSVETQARRYVCTCPVYTLMMCYERPPVMAAVNGADMVTADGVPVVWLQRKRGATMAERVYGPDVMQALCERTANTPARHYFWGGENGVAAALAAQLRSQAAGLQVAGSYSPPIAPLGSEPDASAISRLNDSGADVIWVGLGSPKQDLWMAQHRPYLNAPLLIGVGAAFDMLAGVKKQAPRWMQRTGLEWLFRLLQEPGRLGKRYLIYNPKFLWLTFRTYGW